ncbi:MAG: hypothetical protein COB02_06040 [Candidatus Cloacimonadota bacterium]|nr:MAG: hypothetical protein COB02_12050 [Candidatus Cloacimonadota bacterium]PCJ20159.1 MAG: hypothetical protein COB02_06040 [Candidatus Cloacimonadota bacterium]
MKKLLLQFLFISMSFSLTHQEARHLLSLTSVGFNTNEIKEILPLSKNKAINFIFNLSSDNSPSNTPDYLQKLPTFQEFRKLPKKEKQKLRKSQRKLGVQLQADWYTHLSESKSQLREKMIIFWHNHFVSSLQKVKNPVLMLKQHNLFRKHALGSFKSFLKDIVLDPAMIHYLDTQSNHKKKPNENFARELLELFTLGIGNYTENDIKEIAKSFTGYKANRFNGELSINYRLHDHSHKTIFKKTRRFMAEDIVELLFEQDSLTPFIVKKVSKEFIFKNLSNQKITELSKNFIESSYDISLLIKSILQLDEFWAKENQGIFIKSPVELMIGVVRYFDIKIKDPKIYVKLGRQMNQVLLNPPNVKGWIGGNHWINSHTFIVRKNISNRLSNNMKSMMNTNNSTVNLNYLLAFKYQSQFKKIKNQKKKLRKILSSDYFQLK